MSEKEAEIRASLARLDDAVSADRALSQEDLALLRRQLEESQILVREQQDRSKQVNEENEILTRRKDELEQRLATLESEYEELLGESSEVKIRTSHLLISSPSARRQDDSGRRACRHRPLGQRSGHQGASRSSPSREPC